MSMMSAEVQACHGNKTPIVTNLFTNMTKLSESNGAKPNRRMQILQSKSEEHCKHHNDTQNGPLNRLNQPDGNRNDHCCGNSEENRTSRFVGKRGLTVGDGEDITSARGTVRGVTNRVKAGIMNFTYKPHNSCKEKAVNNEEERNKIIIYTTSMRIVRQTFEDCQFVRKLFHNHRVKYEERDLFMNAKYQQELHDRLLGEVEQVTLPVVFIDGELVGDLERLEELNESGQLKLILERFEKIVPTSNCPECGGFRYIPCLVCNGSKKSLHRNSFTDQFLTLRCSNCDENGLQKCTMCNK